MTDVKISKSHRTALFVSPGSDAERVNRLLESLNGKNIKVDVYGPVAVATTTVQRIGSYSEVAQAAPVEPVFDIDALHKEASLAGYDQILFSVPA